jgi:hypothetical protein
MKEEETKEELKENLLNDEEKEMKNIDETILNSISPYQSDDLNLVLGFKNNASKLNLPPNKKRKESNNYFRDTFLINFLNRKDNGEGTINGSVILLLLLIMRFSPEFLTGEKIYDLYGKDIEKVKEKLKKSLRDGRMYTTS